MTAHTVMGFYFLLKYLSPTAVGDGKSKDVVIIYSTQKGHLMGYTHYWRNVNTITEENIDVINRIINRYEAESDKKIVNGLREKGTQPEVSTELIAFNGEEEQGCETLYIEPGKKGFNCCKTKYRKYDAVVCAVLLYLEQQGVIEELDSDGDMAYSNEWLTAKALLNRALA